MQYVLRPTNKDIKHYAKGSETKSHKYISRVMKNGKWVYTYTNKKTPNSQYSPNIKTKRERTEYAVPDGKGGYEYHVKNGATYWEPNGGKDLSNSSNYRYLDMNPISNAKMPRQYITNNTREASLTSNKAAYTPYSPNYKRRYDPDDPRYNSIEKALANETSQDKINRVLKMIEAANKVENEMGPVIKKKKRR